MNDNNQLCKEAETYYLSFVLGTEYGDVPEHIAEHVETCRRCQNNLVTLKESLLACDDKEALQSKQLTQDQLHILGLHLTHLGREVGCNIAKPFLPSMLERNFKIGTPTPITVHVDRCESCKKDLATIKALELTSKQLKVLSSLFGDKLSGECVHWSDAVTAIQSYVNFDFHTLEPKIVKHICCCSLCQLFIYKLRAKRLENLGQKEVNMAFPCETVSFSDVFDYCFACEAISSNDQYSKFRESFVTHLRQCPKCLGKLQQIHGLIYAIKQRPESGVVTIYNLGEVKDSSSVGEHENIYDGFPLNVKTFETFPQKIIKDVPKRRSTTDSFGVNLLKNGVKYFVKAAVAAVVILAVALFLRSISTAKAVTIEQIYKAIQNATNVHIQKFVMGNSEPVQEKWVSRSLNIYVVQTQDGVTLWNLSKGEKIIKSAGDAKPETSPIDQATLADIMRRKITGSIGLMPFENISQIPDGAKWKESPHLNVGDAVDNTIVYELTWNELTHEGKLLPSKWRAFIDEETYLLRRGELYQRQTNDAKYILIGANNIEYLSKNDILEVLEKFELASNSLRAP